MMWVISQQFAKFTDHEYCSLSVIWTEIHVLSGVYYKSSCFEIFSVISTGHSNLAVLFDSAKSVMSGKLLAICHTIIQVQWNSFFFFCVTWDSVNTVKQNRIICEQGKEKNRRDKTFVLCTQYIKHIWEWMQSIREKNWCNFKVMFLENCFAIARMRLRWLKLCVCWNCESESDFINNNKMKLIQKSLDKGMSGWVFSFIWTWHLDYKLIDLIWMNIARWFWCRKNQKICGTHTIWLVKMTVCDQRQYEKCKMKRRLDRRVAVEFELLSLFASRVLILIRKLVYFDWKVEILRRINMSR